MRELVKTCYTADFHLEHDNIIKYCKRPFADIYEMNEALVTNVNNMMDYGDILYHLGDMYLPDRIRVREGSVYSLSHYEEEIKPDIIYLLGNHDSRKLLKTGIEEAVVRIGKKTRVFMSHHPQTVMPINLCGHVHDTWRIHYTNNMFVVNVGVDMWNYKPIDWDTIYQVIQNHRDFYSGNAERRPILNERVWRTRREQKELEEQKK